MPPRELPQQFGPLDAVFLNFERKEMPLHIGSVSICDGALPFDQFVESIERKLDLLPRYRQKAVRPFLDIGLPTWQYDPKFDIRRHIFHVTLDAPADEAQLRELTGRIFTKLLNRDKPLWEVYVVDGLAGGRSAIVTKVHHCMVDGVSGVGLLNLMFDTSPDTPALPKGAPKRKRYRPPQPPDGVRRQGERRGADRADRRGHALSEAAQGVDAEPVLPRDGAGQPAAGRRSRHAGQLCFDPAGHPAAVHRGSRRTPPPDLGPDRSHEARARGGIDLGGYLVAGRDSGAVAGVGRPPAIAFHARAHRAHDGHQRSRAAGSALRQWEAAVDALSLRARRLGRRHGSGHPELRSEALLRLHLRRASRAGWRAHEKVLGRIVCGIVQGGQGA